MARRSDVVARRLTVGEQRALASFLAGRLPAGQLETELARARGTELLAASVAPPPVAMPAAAPSHALRAA